MTLVFEIALGVALGFFLICFLLALMGAGSEL